MQQIYDYNFYNDWYIIKNHGGRPCFLEDICDDHYYTISTLHRFLNPEIFLKKKLKVPDSKIFTYNENHYGKIVARLNKKRYEVIFISRGNKHNEIFNNYTNGFTLIN